MINSITLIGSSSGRNAGDAALISGIMESIDAACGRELLYEIPTYRPEYVKQVYTQRVRPITMLPWHGSIGMLGLQTLNSILRTDMTLIFDNMLFDRKLYNPLFNFMSTMSLFLPLAKKRGKLLGYYNVGTGPVTTDRGKIMLRDLSELMDFISVRDEDSLQLLKELGVKNQNIILTADAALRVTPATPKRVDEIISSIGFDPNKEILGINVNAYLNTWSADGSDNQLTKEKFADIYAEAIKIVVQKLNVPILFVCTQHHDVKITQMIIDRLDPQIKYYLFTNVQHNHFEVKGVLSRISLLFAMRLHASILCTSALTPAIGLAFQKKVTSYYKTLGLEDCALSFSTFTPQKLAEHIFYGWENRGRIKTVLEAKIPELILKADRAAEVVAKLSNGISAHEAIIYNS
jgi:polysaccharide pyruvyl transferase WcaK-like protein